MRVSAATTRKILALAGQPGRAKPPTSYPAAPSPPPRSRWTLRIDVPDLVVVSTANRREHWAARHNRNRSQAAIVQLALAPVPRVPLPVDVMLVRVGGKIMDGDNLQSAYKAIRDAVADWLGVDDGESQLVRWRYRQRQGGKSGGSVIVFRPRRAN